MKVQTILIAIFEDIGVILNYLTFPFTQKSRDYNGTFYVRHKAYEKCKEKKLNDNFF